MRVAVMQPYLFPYLGYFQLLATADKFLFLNDVTFINRGWINRNRILACGQPLLFTVPLEHASQNRLIKDIRVHGDQRWRSKLLKTFDQSYHKAPYFAQVMPLVERALEPTFIAECAVRSIELVAVYLQLPTVLGPSTSTYGNAHLKGQCRILDLCRAEGATHYINAPGGACLYNGSDFDRQGVDLQFIRPQLRPYPQPAAAFVPGLSIIDLLMQVPAAEARTHLGFYQLDQSHGVTAASPYFA